jgi:hypothetical protein
LSSTSTIGEERERVAAEMVKPTGTEEYIRMILRLLYGLDLTKVTPHLAFPRMTPRQDTAVD